MSRKRILVAYDGTEESFWALEQAVQTASKDDAELGIVTVMPPIVDAPGQALRYLREHDLDADVHVPIGQDAADEIARIAADGRYDTVYVGRRREGAGWAPDASVSRGVTLSAPGNVLIAR